MTYHRVYSDTPLRPGPASIGGDEAHHAIRVKRLSKGDTVEVLDGRGHIARAAVRQTRREGQGWILDLEIQAVSDAPPTIPSIEVCSPAPKGPRLADLIDGLSQVGAARWSLLETQHSAGEPRPGKLDRLARTAAEASKQCGRPWLLEIGDGLSFDAAIALGGPALILADASGDPYQPSAAPAIRLLIGPEGGWSATELDQARAAGVRIARFGPHTMRVETAAIVAAGIILDAESRTANPQNL